MPKQDLFNEISTRRIKPVSRGYYVLAFLGKNFVYKKHNIHVNRKIDVKSLKPPFIMVSNHTSRLDYVYTGAALLPHRMNYVAAFNEFFRSHLAATLKSMNVIPKRSYYSDLHAAREGRRVVKEGGNIAIFPEGEGALAGANQPVLPASGKYLKHFGVPVVYCKIRGGYLTNPKYSLKDRPGYIEVDVDLLFSPEDLKNLSADEIQSKMDNALYHDDFEWNKLARHKYKIRGQGAKNMHHLLYWCPKCNQNHTMLGEGNVIKCTNCGNGATLNEYYDLIPLSHDCVIPKTPRVWCDSQREQIKRQIQDPSFSLSEKVVLGVLDHSKYIKKHKTSIPAGEGIITINHKGFTYEGTKNNLPFSFTIKPENVYSLAYFTDMAFFALYHDDDMYEFTPEDGRTCQFRIAVEEMHRYHGGKWQQTPIEE